MTTTTPVLEGQPFTQERTDEIIAQFNRDGFILIPGVLEPEEVAALQEKTDELMTDEFRDRTSTSIGQGGC